VIAPFISFLLLYRVFQFVSNKRVLDDFLKKCTKISLKLGISASRRVVRLLDQKQLNIDTNILHQVGLGFDVCRIRFQAPWSEQSVFDVTMT